MTKDSIRSRATRRRQAIPSEARRRASEQIQDRLVAHDVFRAARMVCCYLALPDEVSTAAIVRRCWDEGRRVVVPAWCASTRRYGLCLYARGDDLVRGRMRVREPRRRCWMPVTMTDLFVVPGIAFDQTGCRLGYGGGVYDRLLSRSRRDSVCMALAFDGQMQPHLPSEPHDVMMDGVMTETREYTCGNAG